MSGIDAGSEWTTLLGGFLVLGAGVGLLNPVIADVALSVVPKERSGMAAGINDTFRQVGVAVGVAVWGAIFVGQGAAKVSDADRGHASGERRPPAPAGRGRLLGQPQPGAGGRAAARSAGDRARRPRGLPRRHSTRCSRWAAWSASPAPSLALWLVRERDIEREPQEQQGSEAIPQAAAA